MVVLITGASRGLGLAATKNLILRGHVVIGVSRQPPMEAFPPNTFHFFPYDFADTGGLQTLVNSIRERHSQIHALLLNAAAILDDCDLGGLDEGKFLNQIMVNGTAPLRFYFLLKQEALTPLDVTVVSSLSGLFDSYPTRVGYAASKALLSTAFINIMRKINLEDRIRIYEFGLIADRASGPMSISYEDAATRMVDAIESRQKSGLFRLPRLPAIICSLLTRLPFPMQRWLIQKKNRNRVP